MDTLVKKIKIAQVITRLDKGGAPEIVLYITRGLDPVRFETTLISGLTQDAQASPEEINKWGIEYVNIPFLRRQINLIFDVVAFFRLCALFRRKRFDIVHTHTSKAGALGRLAARCAGVPVIIHTPHGHVFYGYFRPLMNWLLVWVEKFLTYFCDMITTLTDHEKSDLIRYGIAKEDKLAVIYNGVELDKFYQNTVDIAQKKRELHLSLDGPVICSVSRLEPVKGLFYFLAAARLVCDFRQDSQFLIVGDGSLRQELEKAAKGLGLSKNVIFTGLRQDIPEILKIVDMIVLTSLNEGMGISLLEAQASAKPVVATRVGGVPEAVLEGVTGILVPPADPGALASAIKSLIEDRSKAIEMGEAARKWAASKFDITNSLQEYFRLYAHLYAVKKAAIAPKRD